MARLSNMFCKNSCLFAWHLWLISVKWIFMFNYLRFRSLTSVVSKCFNHLCFQYYLKKRHPFIQGDLNTHLYCKIKVNWFVVILYFFLSHWRTGWWASQRLLKCVAIAFCPSVPLLTNYTSPRSFNNVWFINTETVLCEYKKENGIKIWLFLLFFFDVSQSVPECKNIKY